MGTLKNISGEPLDVPLLRRTVGLGDDGGGEEIEVDDSLLTNSGLVWPAETWLVNGASHEHDENSPENTAKREEAERLAAEEAERAAAEEPAAEPAAAEEPITISDLESPVPLNIAMEGRSDGRGLPDPLPDGGLASEATAEPIRPKAEEN